MRANQDDASAVRRALGEASELLSSYEATLLPLSHAGSRNLKSVGALKAIVTLTAQIGHELLSPGLVQPGALSSATEKIGAAADILRCAREELKAGAKEEG